MFGFGVSSFQIDEIRMRSFLHRGKSPRWSWAKNRSAEKGLGNMKCSSPPQGANNPLVNQTPKKRTHSTPHQKKASIRWPKEKMRTKLNTHQLPPPNYLPYFDNSKLNLVKADCVSIWTGTRNGVVTGPLHWFWRENTFLVEMIVGQA